MKTSEGFGCCHCHWKVQTEQTLVEGTGLGRDYLFHSGQDYYPIECIVLRNLRQVRTIIKQPRKKKGMSSHHQSCSRSHPPIPIAHANATQKVLKIITITNNPEKEKQYPRSKGGKINQISSTTTSLSTTQSTAVCPSTLHDPSTHISTIQYLQFQFLVLLCHHIPSLPPFPFPLPSIEKSRFIFRFPTPWTTTPAPEVIPCLIRHSRSARSPARRATASSSSDW